MSGRTSRPVIRAGFPHRLLQVLPVQVVVGRVLQDLSEQQRVLHQPAARDVQEVPQVQLPAERRLQAALQEVLDPPVLLLLVQQGLGLHLVAAVRRVGGETRQLQGHKHIAMRIPAQLQSRSYETEKRLPSRSGCGRYFPWFRRVFWRLVADSASLRKVRNCCYTAKTQTLSTECWSKFKSKYPSTLDKRHN